MNSRAIFLICLVLAGCVHPENSGRVQQRSVDGLSISADGQAYAEVILIGQDPQSPECCRGIAIRYYDSDKYEWISPRGGWQLKKDGVVYDQIPDVYREWGPTDFPKGEVLNNYHRVNDDTFGKMEMRCNVSVVKDGTEVTFGEAGLFGLKQRRISIK